MESKRVGMARRINVHPYGAVGARVGPLGLAGHAASDDLVPAPDELSEDVAS